MSAAGNRLQDTARRVALALPEVSHGYPFTPGLDVYKVASKVFLIVTDDPDEQIITVKCEPEHARAQERGYASITLDQLTTIAAERGCRSCGPRRQHPRRRPGPGPPIRVYAAVHARPEGEKA